ncbi:hypothetical protein STEG23_031706 [Scotinomys teguina]
MCSSQKNSDDSCEAEAFRMEEKQRDQVSSFRTSRGYSHSRLFSLMLVRGQYHMVHFESKNHAEGKSKKAIKSILQKCTYLPALEPFLYDAPPNILKHVVGQFSKVLPHDSKARRLFVTSGGLKKVQEMKAEPGSLLQEYINSINNCYPEEIVRSIPSIQDCYKHRARFVYMMDYIDRLSYIESSLNLWDEAYFIMAKMGRRQCKSAYNIIKNKTTPESSPQPTPKSDYCNADKAEENDLKKSLMKMLEEAFEEKMKNVSKEIGENTNKKLEEINKEIEEKKSKKLEEMNNEIEEKKNKKLEEMNNEIEEKKNKRVEEMNKEIEEKRNKKLQELDKEIEEKINKKLKEMNKEIEEKTNKKLEEINKVIEEKTNKKLDEINKEIEDKTNKKLEKINKEIDEKKPKNWKK